MKSYENRWDIASKQVINSVWQLLTTDSSQCDLHHVLWARNLSCSWQYEVCKSRHTAPVSWSKDIYVRYTSWLTKDMSTYQCYYVGNTYWVCHIWPMVRHCCTIYSKYVIQYHWLLSVSKDFAKFHKHTE